ncbi:hypothetical protein ACQP2P_31265 [Dactylosporangium sp. CA-139114]|uniref:hypothetical protein n=1 Tax=Dactylosporangium sp. CA-139114 TaxID=3239931 RepID=UPI003D99FA91
MRRLFLVAGDVARFPHPVHDYQFMALEHWGNAVDQAEIASPPRSRSTTGCGCSSTAG